MESSARLLAAGRFASYVSQFGSNHKLNRVEARERTTPVRDRPPTIAPPCAGEVDWRGPYPPRTLIGRHRGQSPMSKFASEHRHVVRLLELLGEPVEGNLSDPN